MKSILTVLSFVLAAGIAAGVPEPSTTVPHGRVEVGRIDAVVVKRVLPKYPVALWQRGIEGSVLLDIAVDAQGRVVAITTINATDQAFAFESRRAVRQWQFAKPASVSPEGRAVYRLPIEFKLRRD